MFLVVRKGSEYLSNHHSHLLFVTSCARRELDPKTIDDTVLAEMEMLNDQQVTGCLEVMKNQKYRWEMLKQK